ncbi:TetR family transcriptional regulator [Chachezhania sediminis]|uniref:TetR family transcriptional regulator n=1 Tax=Chachezhania sediminis TaxID=2599291 RepID=UPI00131C946A|nr:TetR family transcriptional regulator [Chachezhania sediminis]
MSDQVPRVVRTVTGPQKRPKAKRGRPTLAELSLRPDTRSMLLAAANDLMIEKDTVEISMNEVAERTGQAAALVQYHFGSKEGLLMALAEKQATRAVEASVALMKRDLPATEKLRHHVHGMVNTFYEAPYLNRLLDALMRDGQTQTANQIGRVIVRPVVGFYNDLLKQGREEGVFRDIDPMAFYFLLVGACDHLFARRSALSAAFGIDRVSPELKQNYASFVYDLVVSGIRR